MKYMIINLDVISIYINNELINQLRQYRQLSKFDPETGGMVFGKVSVTNQTVYIESISTAHVTDYHSKYQYIRSIEHAKKEIDDRVVPGEYITYVGEWHTHPCQAYMSSLDRKSHKRINKTTMKFFEGLIVIVVGDTNDILFAYLDKKNNLYQRKVLIDVQDK